MNKCCQKTTKKIFEDIEDTIGYEYPKRNVRIVKIHLDNLKELKKKWCK